MCGAVLLVIGLYGILLGKNQEEKIQVEAEKEGKMKERSEQNLQTKEESELESITCDRWIHNRSSIDDDIG